MKGFEREGYEIQNVTLKDVTLINVTPESALNLKNYKDFKFENIKYEIRSI